MHKGKHDIKTFESEIVQIEHPNNPDLQDSDEKNVNNKANALLENVKIQKSSGKREDHFKNASPVPLSEVNTGNIPPDINTDEIMYKNCNKEHSGDNLRKVGFIFESEDIQSKAKATVELENMKVRTRKWVDHFRHESIDPLVTSEPRYIHDKAKATVELTNMNERTMKWVDHEYMDHGCMDHGHWT